MTDLKELIPPGTPEQNWEHNWLYSVVPARMSGLAWEPSPNNKTISEIGIYLAGYCRNCTKGFSIPIPFGTDYIETQLNIPRFGCADPRFRGI